MANPERHHRKARVTAHVSLGPLADLAAATQKEVVVNGLRTGCKYHVKALAHNAHGWGPESPSSEAAETGSAPGKPCAPILEAAGPNKLNVIYAAPPARPSCTHVAIHLRESGTDGWQSVKGNVSADGARFEGTLLPRGEIGSKFALKDSYTEQLGLIGLVTEVLISGLQGGVKYEAAIAVTNAIGTSSTSEESDAVECEGDDVEVTGERSWEDRDAAARKRAMDVSDYESPPLKEQRIKQDGDATLDSLRRDPAAMAACAASLVSARAARERSQGASRGSR